MTAIRDRRGYSPAPTCYGWTCPSCNRHWISVFRIGAMTCSCGHYKAEHGAIPYAVKKARARARYRSRRLLDDIRPQPLSEVTSNLAPGAEREAIAP